MTAHIKDINIKPISFRSLNIKLLLPFAGLMLLMLLVSGIVFEYGTKKTSDDLLAAEVSLDLDRIVSNLSARKFSVSSSADVLSQNPDIITALASASEEEIADVLEEINGRAIVVRDRFSLDLVQIYNSNGLARTNIVQSSLYRVSSLLDQTGSHYEDVLFTDGELLFVASRPIGGSGGVVITGIDLREEINRIAAELNLSGDLLIEVGDPLQVGINEFYWSDTHDYIGEHTFTFGSQPIRVTLTRGATEIHQVVETGRNVTLYIFSVTAFLILLLSSLVIILITRPIRELASASKALTTGDFEAAMAGLSATGGYFNPFRIGEDDELGLLISNFGEMIEHMRARYQELIDDLEESYTELNYAYDATLQGWSNALELRDHETERHTNRVVDISLGLAKILEVSDEELVHIRRGALLHDIGKLAIPDNILRKPGPLTSEEWTIMRQHPLYSFVMLRSIEYLKEAVVIPYAHHERWNGSGYPRGLAGNEIPYYARIFMVADVWDALLSNRPYRKAWSVETSLAYMKENAGVLFDPKVIDAFLVWFEQNHAEETNQMRNVFMSVRSSGGD